MHNHVHSDALPYHLAITHIFAAKNASWKRYMQPAHENEGSRTKSAESAGERGAAAAASQGRNRGAPVMAPTSVMTSSSQNRQNHHNFDSRKLVLGCTEYQNEFNEKLIFQDVYLSKSKHISRRTSKF